MTQQKPKGNRTGCLRQDAPSLTQVRESMQGPGNDRGWLLSQPPGCQRCALRDQGGQALHT